MRDELVQMFAATNLLADAEQNYVLVQLHPSAYRTLLRLLAEHEPEGFQTVIRAHDEVALLCTAELWASLGEQLHPTSIDQPWRLITLDVTIPLDVYGYLEQVASICADCEASMVVESDYSTDHIFVKADRFHDVVENLNAFIDDCRSSASGR